MKVKSLFKLTLLTVFSTMQFFYASDNDLLCACLYL